MRFPQPTRCPTILHRGSVEWLSRLTEGEGTLENRRALARTRQRCAALIMMIKVVPGGVEIPSRVASTLCSTRESLPRVAVRFKEEEECVHVLGDKECTETAVCEQGTHYTCDNVAVVSCVKNVCVCVRRPEKLGQLGSSSDQNISINCRPKVWSRLQAGRAEHWTQAT